MPLETTWLQEPHIIVARAHGKVTVAEIVGSGTAVNEWVSTGAPPVHVLVDLTDLQGFPTSIQALKQGIPYRDNPNLGWIIVYGASSMATTFGQILLSVTRARFQLFNTREEALAFLARQDSRVPSP